MLLYGIDLLGALSPGGATHISAQRIFLDAARNAGRIVGSKAAVRLLLACMAVAWAWLGQWAMMSRNGELESECTCLAASCMHVWAPAAAGE